MNVQLPRLLALELTVIATGVIIFFASNLIGKFGEIAIILTFAVLLTYALLPAVNFLSQFRYLHRAVAVTIVYILMFAVIGGAVALVSVPLAKQLEQLARDYPKYSDQLRDTVPRLQSELQKRDIRVDLDQQARDLTNSLGGAGRDVARKSGDIIAGVFGTLSVIFLVLFIGVYFLYGGKRFADAVIGFFPRRRQRMVRKLATEYDRILGSFVRGNLVVALIVFVLVTLFSVVIGLPYSVLSGLIAALTSLIPVIGAFLGVAVPIAIAALVHPVLIPIILIFFLVLNEFTHKLLYPKIVGDALELHPLVVLIGLLIGVKLAGITGALLATPIIALGRVTVIALSKTTGYGRR